jgi:hypothetical protein
VVKTFDHEKASWMEPLTREIKPPKIQSHMVPETSQQLLSLISGSR